MIVASIAAEDNISAVAPLRSSIGSDWFGIMCCVVGGLIGSISIPKYQIRLSDVVIYPIVFSSLGTIVVFFIAGGKIC